MPYLSVIGGLSFVIWIAVGILLHANWIQNIFKLETLKINSQRKIIREYGYESISPARDLEARKGFVFGYWNDESVSNSVGLDNGRSPRIFQIVNLNLIAITSAFALIIVSRGLFTLLGVY